MINLKQVAARRSGMAERAAAMMQIHFPNYPEVWIWLRTRAKGFTTIPRTMPLVMEAVDRLSKGQPAGHTLFCLWARAPDGPMVVIENPATFAAEAGFTGARAVDTWRRRMKVLRDHHFLHAKKGSSGDFHYVLLLNPNVTVEYLRQTNEVQDDLYGRFRDRLAEIGGAADIDAYHAYAIAQAQAKSEADSIAAQQLKEAIPSVPGTKIPSSPRKSKAGTPKKRIAKHKK